MEAMKPKFRLFRRTPTSDWVPAQVLSDGSINPFFRPYPLTPAELEGQYAGHELGPWIDTEPPASTPTPTPVEPARTTAKPTVPGLYNYWHETASPTTRPIVYRVSALPYDPTGRLFAFQDDNGGYGFHITVESADAGRWELIEPALNVPAAVAPPPPTKPGLYKFTRGCGGGKSRTVRVVRISGDKELWVIYGDAKNPRPTTAARLDTFGPAHWELLECYDSSRICVAGSVIRRGGFVYLQPKPSASDASCSPPTPTPKSG